MPRPYRLGERVAQVQATRARIVEAAIGLYTEKGISGTTMRDIGLSADVAPGTLRNHFPTREPLERAVVDRLTDAASLPDGSIFDGARSIGERLGRLILATGRFLDQAQPIYRMWLREPMVSGPWAEKGAEYGARWDELTRIALGRLADDDEARAILRGVMHPTFFDSVRGGSRTTDEASELIAAALVPWFTERERAAARLPSPPTGRARDRL